MQNPMKQNFNKQNLAKQNLAKQNLTSSQKKILDFIEQHTEKVGTPPTYEAIAKHFGYSTKSSVQHYIEILTQKGYLTKEKHLSQSLSVQREPNVIPLLGKVAAGKPLESRKFGERIEVPREMLKGEGSFFALQVAGESMIGEGILDGDYVVIKEQSSANNGDIIVAEVDDEATIKRFYKKRGHIELHSANVNFKPIIIAEHIAFRIAGIFCGLIRY